MLCPYLWTRTWWSMPGLLPSVFTHVERIPCDHPTESSRDNECHLRFDTMFSIWDVNISIFYIDESSFRRETNQKKENILISNYCIIFHFFAFECQISVLFGLGRYFLMFLCVCVCVCLWLQAAAGTMTGCAWASLLTAPEPNKHHCHLSLSLSLSLALSRSPSCFISVFFSFPPPRPLESADGTFSAERNRHTHTHTHTHTQTHTHKPGL